VVGTHSLVEKLVGMQMMFEPTALTIFKLVREQRFEPVLADLLVYFERDEARHVGLGIQALPELMRNMWPHEHARLAAFQLRVIGHILRSLRALEPELRVLGLSARDVLEAGVLKHQFYSQQMLAQVGFETRAIQEVAKRSVIAVCELMFPREAGSTRSRLRKAAHVMRHGIEAHAA